MVESNFSPAFVHVPTDGRITIPEALRERISWIKGDQPLTVWLLTVLPGRFRLLSETQVGNDAKLSLIRSQLIDGPNEPDLSVTTFEPSERAAVVGRLTCTTLSPPRPSWRLSIPKQIVPQSATDRPMLVLLFASGFLEVWHQDVYNQALNCRIDSVL